MACWGFTAHWTSIWLSHCSIVEWRAGGTWQQWGLAQLGHLQHTPLPSVPLPLSVSASCSATDEQRSSVQICSSMPSTAASNSPSYRQLFSVCWPSYPLTTHDPTSCVCPTPLLPPWPLFSMLPNCFQSCLSLHQHISRTPSGIPQAPHPYHRTTTTTAPITLVP